MNLLSSAQSMKDVMNVLSGVIDEHPLCVEVGCTYVCSEGNEVHTTTNNIGDLCAQANGHLISIDVDPESIKFAKAFTGEPFHITFMTGPAEHILQKPEFQNISMLVLDGANEPHQALIQFKTIQRQLAEHHFVLVDDIHNPNAHKWKKVVPFLKEAGYKWIEIPTPTGLFVAWKNYNLGDSDEIQSQ